MLELCIRSRSQRVSAPPRWRRTELAASACSPARRRAAHRPCGSCYAITRWATWAVLTLAAGRATSGDSSRSSAVGGGDRSSRSRRCRVTTARPPQARSRPRALRPQPARPPDYAYPSASLWTDLKLLRRLRRRWRCRSSAHGHVGAAGRSSPRRDRARSTVTSTRTVRALTADIRRRYGRLDALAVQHHRRGPTVRRAAGTARRRYPDRCRPSGSSPLHPVCAPEETCDPRVRAGRAAGTRAGRCRFTAAGLSGPRWTADHPAPAQGTVELPRPDTPLGRGAPGGVRVGAHSRLPRGWGGGSRRCVAASGGELLPARPVAWSSAGYDGGLRPEDVVSPPRWLCLADESARRAYAPPRDPAVGGWDALLGGSAARSVAVELVGGSLHLLQRRVAVDRSWGRSVPRTGRRGRLHAGERPAATGRSPPQPGVAAPRRAAARGLMLRRSASRTGPPSPQSSATGRARGHALPSSRERRLDAVVIGRQRGRQRARRARSRRPAARGWRPASRTRPPARVGGARCPRGRGEYAGTSGPEEVQVLLADDAGRAGAPTRLHLGPPRRGNAVVAVSVVDEVGEQDGLVVLGQFVVEQRHWPSAHSAGWPTSR